MKSVVRFSLNQIVFYNLVFVLMIVAGAYALLSVPIERYPPVNFGEVIIETVYPGASPQDVETLITKKIEDVLETVPNIEYINSTSYRERSSIHLKFLDDTDYEGQYDEVRFKVLSMLEELPDDVDPPTLNDISISDFLPVLRLNFVGERSNRALTLMAEELQVRINRIAGVQEAKISGEYTREFHVYLDPDKLRQYGVTYDDVSNALQRANISIPAGNFNYSGGEFLVRVNEQFRSREQVIDTIIRRDGDGGYVRVKDVISRAEVGYRDPFVISSVNGEPSLNIEVLKTDSGNAVYIKEQVAGLIEEYQPVLDREGVKLIITEDSTVYIREGLSTLGSNMLLGILLVTLIIWYFMGVRNAGLTTIGIPFAFMVTLLIIYITGNSLNEISLFAFVLMTGIVVDDAIVVVENIYRHVEQGERLREAIINGTSEVALPVIAATSTTVAAFLPMLIMTGTTGEFFAQIPTTVAFAILASLIECLLILPVHYLDFGPRPKVDGKPHSMEEHDNIIMRGFRIVTHWLVNITLRFRILSLLAVFLVFVAALGIFMASVLGYAPLIRIEFFPDDYKLYYVEVWGPSRLSVEEMSQDIKKISEFVMEDGEQMASSAVGLAGFQITEDYESVFSPNIGLIIVTLPTIAEQRFADYPKNDPIVHLDWMRQRLKAEFEKNGYTIRVRAVEDGPPTGKDVNVRVVGNNFESLNGLAAEIEGFLRNTPTVSPHLVDIGNDVGYPNRVLNFNVKREQAHEYDLDAVQVAFLAGSVLDGRYVGKYRVADEEIDLKLRVDPDALLSPSEALNIPLLEHPAGAIRLGDVAEVVTTQEPAYLNRYQGKRAITITANLKPNTSSSVPVIVKQVQDFYDSVRDQYPGASVTFGGAHESTQRSYTSLAYAFILALLIMYMILATQFKSYWQPLIILSAVIFSVIGVIFGTFLSQTLFTVNSFIAMVGVTGVVVNDSLVLIDFINRAYRQGMSRREAIEYGIKTRLRPILLTTLTTSLGLLPMALGIPSYSLVWGAMASTFVTGLAAATALTLFIVPVQWDLMQGISERLHGRHNQTN